MSSTTGGFRQRHGAAAVRAVDPAAALRAGGGRRRVLRDAAAHGRARVRQRPPRHAHTTAAGMNHILLLLVRSSKRACNLSSPNG